MENGLATFGQGYALFSAIIGTFIAIVFVIAGYNLYYTPDAPPKPGQKNPVSNKIMGLIISGVGVIIGAGSWGVYYLASKNKGFAEVEGAMGGINLVRDIF